MLTKEDIQAIADRDNLIVRNLEITQGYHRLSRGMKRWMSFVVDFFRAHQQSKCLFEAPFLDSQIPAIDAGYMSVGTL